MKQKTTQTRSRWLLACLLSLLMTLGGASPAWGETITAYDGSVTNANIPFYGLYIDERLYKTEYIVPATDLSAIESGSSLTKLKFYTNAASNNYGGTFQIFLEETESTSLSEYSKTSLTPVYEGGLSTNASSELEITFTNSYTYHGGNLLISIYQTANGTYKSTNFYGKSADSYVTWTGYGSSAGAGSYFAPKTTITYEAPVTGPGFAVKDGSTKLSSPYAYNFGLATAGTTKTFTLTNPGTAATPIELSTTGNVGASIGGAESIAAGGEVTLTLTMPDADASGTVTVTPTGDGLNPFVFNVSGTKRDANKVYEYGFTSLPDDWSTTGTWYYNASNGAYTTVWYLSSNARLITPKLTIAEGEKFFVEAKGYSTSNTSYQHLQMQYSADGTSWTNFDSEPALDPNDWKTFEFTGAPAGSYYIAINASQADIRMFYGGQLPLQPKLSVSQTEDINLGIINEDTKTSAITITNTGKAPLTGLSIALSGTDAEKFSIVDKSTVETTLAVDASMTFKIQMSAATPGSYSATVNIGADDPIGANAASFKVSGAKVKAGTSTMVFNSANILAENWTNSGMTIQADNVYNGNNPTYYYIESPKLVSFESGDFLVAKVKNYNTTWDDDYVKIEGSDDNGSTWTKYNKSILSTNFLNGENFYYIVFDGSDLVGVNKIRIRCYYAHVYELSGFNYAPILSVTTGLPATPVSSPAAYDFGECAANATVTYNFANAGAGTINITNVAITGAGAAAYSTNWTESVAAPFALTITRSYDAGRAGAQEAVVTVTTSEGDFVINVTGTDKAANAPELSVSTNAIDFGKVTANAVETVTVTNTGTGTMAVDIASDSEDFEVSPASLTGIGAGESKTFDITFKYGTPYGVKNGNVTVTPTYDAEAAQVITVTGKAKDPATWSEDFSGGELPTGWEAGTNWTIADGKAKATYEYGVTNYLTTAPLTVSATTDELTFDYEVTGTYVTITIQQSKDGGAWETCTATPTLNSLDNGAAGTATITGLEAGTYQFRFKNDDYQLDNFEGFVLNLPDHMMAITTSSIPSSGLKEGQSFDASVRVKEKRGVAEADVVAKVYMGSTLIGTSAATAFTANESKDIVISCTPTAGGDDIEMHIEVEYAGGTLNTSPVTRDITPIYNLTLDETSDDPFEANTYDNLTLKRKFTTGWNTVCLPFTISDVEAFFGENAKAYNFTSYSEGTLGFTSVNSLTASYPYVVYVPTAITDDIVLHNITIAAGDVTAFYRYQSGAYFRGTYIPIAAGSWPAGAYGVTSDGKIAPGNTSTSFMKGFRAYFTGITAGARLSFFDETTGITTVIDAKELNNDGKVYNLNGQRVENAHKGLYIVNGRKVVVK